MSERKFILGKEPFIRKADNKQSTSVIMYDYMIALIPLILFAWVKNGILPFYYGDANFIEMIYPLIFITAGGFFSVIIEYSYYYFTFLSKGEKDASKKASQRMGVTFPAIPGLLLAMILSVNTPIWVLLMGCIVATLLAKLLFGGFGQNVFNPALVGYLFVGVAYITLINHPTYGYFNPTELRLFGTGFGDIIAGPTPMTEWSQSRIGNVIPIINKYGLLNMFLGFTPGSMAETSALLCLISLVYLLIRKVTNWIIPITYLVTVFVLTYIIGAFNGFALDLRFALFGLLNGGLMFGAVFMATEPVTSPRSPNGKFIYALGLGVLTVLFRYKSRNPEGVASAILVMNLLTILVDQIAARLRVSTNVRKVVMTYSVIGLMLAGISAYTISAYVQKEEPILEDTVVFESKTQNFDNFNFEYSIKVNDEVVVVTTDLTYAITNVNVAKYNTDDFKTKFVTVINANKFTVWITNVTEGDSTITVLVSSKGYASTINSEVVFDSTGKISGFTTNATNESYEEEYNAGWQEANGHPDQVLPPRIVSTQDNLDSIQVVSGATITSNAIINAAKYAKEYYAYAANSTTLKYVSKSQDNATLNFIYKFKKGLTSFNVTTDRTYNIVSISDNTFDNQETRTLLSTEINKNKFADYISLVETSGTSTVVTVKTKGYASTITTVFTFNESKQITSAVVTATDESYEHGEWTSANGTIESTLKDRIIAGQDNLTQVQVISGATYTSTAVIKAAQIAKGYMEAK